MTTAAPIPCADCGRPVQDITAKEWDRMSNPGRVWCEHCQNAEAETISPATTKPERPNEPRRSENDTKTTPHHPAG